MPGGAGLPATKEGSLDLALELQDELHASGMRWLHMIITDRVDQPMGYLESVAWAEYIISHTEADFLCTGWEFPDPTRGGGFEVADGTEWGWSGNTWKLLNFLGVLRDLAPLTPLDVHFRPGWWAPAGPDDTHDHTLWNEGRNRELTFGLLYQPRLLLGVRVPLECRGAAGHCRAGQELYGRWCVSLFRGGARPDHLEHAHGALRPV